MATTELQTDADVRPWRTSEVRQGQVFVPTDGNEDPPLMVRRATLTEAPEGRLYVAQSLVDLSAFDDLARGREALAFALDGAGYRPLRDDEVVIVRNR